MRFLTCPHPEQVLVEGKNRSTKIACPPTTGILVSKNCSNWPSPASAIASFEFAVLEHPLDMQVLQSHDTTRPSHLSGELVLGILPPVGNLAVETRQFHPGLLPVLAALFG